MLEVKNHPSLVWEALMSALPIQPSYDKEQSYMKTNFVVLIHLNSLKVKEVF